jgi:phthiocerol/phenolphthiocerol synthesis type-I polyketide synthase C
VPGPERVYQIHADGRSVPRFVKGLPGGTSAGVPEKSAIALHFPRPGMLENFQWLTTEKGLPGPGDIEVEIAASGLNFRDVMLAMGLLNDDVVDEGAAGAVYGFECAGRVTAKGNSVTQHEIGDLVIGFGKHTFATHVVAPQESFVALPDGLSIEAGAGIPVAFFTSWYSLIELARLAPGEKVLIHGGAGGVGLAAIQIARAVGAEVVATVSTPDKRALAELYGAQHICDSRSLDFAEYVRDTLGGVDVVLNSLSGEAMRASVRCLKPRGRFIELGKRDYVANTSIGVRPFRRNLSYFGVDVDQILALDPAMTVRGLREVMIGFEDGRYMPLPCMPYDAVEIGSAFRLMQSAGHVGKVVIRPPSMGRLLPASMDAFMPGEGVHLVVGGTRGFGLETAFWLAGKGATKVVVASRGGAIDPKHVARIGTARANGCTFLAESVDVTDLSDVEALVDRVVRSHGNIVGVYHTAVTLQDGMLEDLSAEALDAVLAPKVTGAANLDRATRTQPVQQFVLFSSASAVIGNPGQSAYAAANGYLEGLARQRRKEGLPALAIAWGAIADVGLLADRAETMKSLSRISGVAGMQSADALHRLERILGAAPHLSDPVVTCAEFAAEGALVALPLLSSPGFTQIFTGRGSANVEIGMSLAELIEGKSDAEAQRILTGVVAEEVAQILRLATQEIDLESSIDSLGMDSLMALELRMSIETKYKLELPVMSITSVSNLRDLAQRLLQILRREGGPEADELGLSSEESQLIAMHTDVPLNPLSPGWQSEPRASSGGRQ